MSKIIARKFLATVAISSLLPVAYDPGRNCWKLAADGKTIEVDDKGNPIWIGADGTETGHGADTIQRLNNEAKTNRERYERAETQLETFKGIDPTKAREAIETVGKFKQGELITAGKVDEVREEVKRTMQAQLDEKDKALASANGRIDDMTIDGLFSGSQFIKDSIAIPPDFFRSQMRGHVEIKDGKATFKHKTGEPVYSKKRAGELADFDEAMSIIVENHPQKDAILKSSNQTGSGGSNGGARPGQRVIKRAEFSKLDPHTQASEMEKINKGEAVFTD